METVFCLLVLYILLNQTTLIMSFQSLFNIKTQRRNIYKINIDNHLGNTVFFTMETKMKITVLACTIFSQEKHTDLH